MKITKSHESDEDEEVMPQSAPKQNPKCIVCEAKAELCMRGLPNNTYCIDCAEAYFGLLEYLDKL